MSTKTCQGVSRYSPRPVSAKSRLRAPYEVLCAVIGNPVHKPRPGERVAWDVDVDGARARFHAHPDDRPVGWGGQTSIFETDDAIWRVEAVDDEQLAWVCTRVAERVIEAVAKKSGPRTLSAEDKAAVNALLKQGVSLSAAMKQVQAQPDDTRARRRYGWPPVEVTPASRGHGDGDDDDDGDGGGGGGDDGGGGGHGAGGGVASPSATPPAAAKPASPSSKPVATGPRIARDVPRGTIEAPFERMCAALGAPEDRPVPFVSTRWRFVLDGDRIVRWEDEPSDDPRDVDASVFDRMSRFDAPFAAREAPTATWTVTSSTQDHLERVLAWLKAKAS